VIEIDSKILSFARDFVNNLNLEQYTLPLRKCASFLGKSGEHVMMNHMRFTLFFFFLCFALRAWAYELVTIQSVSTTKKTFITRTGQRQGIVLGQRSTFTADDVAVLAQAMNVTGEFTQWKLVNDEATVPFEKGTIATWYNTTEYLWALNPEEERLKYIKYREAKPQQAFIFKGSLGQSISASESGSNAAEVKHSGYLVEALYENGIASSLAYNIGVRQHWESASSNGVRSSTTRSMLLADLVYYFDAFKHLLEQGKIFAAAGIGFGPSSTTTNATAQSGTVLMLPSVRIGLDLPFDQRWHFLVETGFETLQTKEDIRVGGTQTRNQTNLKGGFGLKRFF
jgi:hypothetical protein